MTTIYGRQGIQTHATMVLPHHPNNREVSQMDQTPSQIRNGELAKWRQQVIADLRALANTLERTSRHEFPTPDIHLGIWSIEDPTDEDRYMTRAVDQEQVRLAMAAAPGSWRKHSGTDQISYYKRFGESVSVAFYVNRSTTCTRVQTGTKVVPATAEHEEAVYEWVCNEPELEVK